MNLIVAPVFLPLFTGLIAVLCVRLPLLRRIGITLSGIIQLAIAITLVTETWNGGRLGLSLGNWAAPYGIVLVADQLSALMVLISTALGLTTTLYSLREHHKDSEHPLRLPLIQFLLCGVHLSFLTGDLFNLFVAFEVMLIASYALLTLEIDDNDVQWGFPYLAINLFGTALFLTAAALCYALFGTLNLADIGMRLDQMEMTPAIQGFIVLISLVFALKSGLFPLYYYLPNSYAVLPFPVAALYAGLLTKVGIYMILRLYGTVLPHGLTGHYQFIGWVAVLTMLLGVIGAVSRNTSRGILSYHCLSQIGFIVLPIAFFTPLGIAASIFYLIQYILVKSTLFLVAGVATILNRTDNLSHTGNLWRATPWVGILFFIQALSLAGIPPFSGFWAKFQIIQQGIIQHSYLWTGAVIIASMLTLFSMLKIWLGVFWKEDPNVPVVKNDPRWHTLLWITLLLILPSILLGLYPEWLIECSNQAASTLLDREGYQQFVFSLSGKGGLP